jgi:hypothetical protein
LLLGEPSTGLVLLALALASIVLLRELMRRHDDAPRSPSLVPALVETS